MNWWETLHQSETWTTRDGEKLRIQEMETSHLRHTLVFLQRNAHGIANYAGLESCFMSRPNGDMAQLAVDSALEQEWDEQLADPVGWIQRTALHRAMAEELERRVSLPERGAVIL